MLLVTPLHTFRSVALAASVLWLMMQALPDCRCPAAEAPAEVRVGFVAFQDFEKEWERYKELFTEVSRASGETLRFRLASGTYGDVLHWLEQELVDVAILSPGVAAASLRESGLPGAAPACQYLATKGMRPARALLATSARQTPGYHDHYNSVCVVRAGSAITDVQGLRRALTAGRAQILFVHPLSVSGHLAPLFALRQLLSPAEFQRVREKAVFTASHSNSVRLLCEPGLNQERVAFLYDDALSETPEAEPKLRRIAFPDLEALSIPADAIVARQGYAQAGRVAELLLRHQDGNGVTDFLRFEDGAAAYQPALAWVDALGSPAASPEAQMVSLDEIGWLLLHDARSQLRPLRLALVLSGGGAKCAYQVGVIQALEQKLADLRRLHPGQKLDISLVVGTSGGAINALPVALGITETPSGQESFCRLWQELDQRQIICPPRLVRANLGLWLACLQLALVGVIARRVVADPARRVKAVSAVLVALALPVIALSLAPWRPWTLLGRNHVLHHAWLWGSFGMLYSAWCLFGLGVAGALAQTRRRRCSWLHQAAQRRLLWIPVTGILLLPLAQFVTMLLLESSLSEGSGIERALSRRLTGLIDADLSRQGLRPLDLRAYRTDAERLRGAGREISRRRLLRRDLVMTGSCLSRTAAELPSDLYFYAPVSQGTPPPRYGAQGISLQEKPELLLDVMMGSGAIFPLFPARSLEDFPRPGERAELIDGGFAHNSPIEAAVLWGATHIVLVNPTPECPIKSGHLAGNLIAAFRHLHFQAQLIDVRNKGKVAVFSLRPGPTRMCVLDFAGNLITEAMATGYADARGAAGQGDLQRSGRPRFRKEIGEPSHWVDVSTSR